MHNTVNAGRYLGGLTFSPARPTTADHSRPQPTMADHPNRDRGDQLVLPKPRCRMAPLRSVNRTGTTAPMRLCTLQWRKDLQVINTQVLRFAGANLLGRPDLRRCQEA